MVEHGADERQHVGSELSRTLPPVRRVALTEIATVLGQVFLLGSAPAGTERVVVGDAHVVDVGGDGCGGSSRPYHGGLLSLGGHVLPGHRVEAPIEVEVAVLVHGGL